MKPHVIGGVTIKAPMRPEYNTILTPEALEFVAHLSRWGGSCGKALPSDTHVLLQAGRKLADAGHDRASGGQAVLRTGMGSMPWPPYFWHP